jgi:preprotein translocase subunit YajC
MSHWFLAAWLLAEGENAPSPTGGILNFLFPLLIIFFLFNFIMLRPEKKKRLAHEAMLKCLKKNDRVLTSSGIFGVVTNVQHDTGEVTIRIDETTNTKVRMTLASVAQVFGDTAEPENKEAK